MKYSEEIMAKVTRHTGFKDLKGQWHLREVSIPVDVNNKGMPVWPVTFHAWGSIWKCSGANASNTKLFYTEVGEQEVNTPTEEIPNDEEYINQLEDFCNNQSQVIEDQVMLITKLKEELTKK